MSDLKKNVAYNFVYQLLILFLPFVTAPYLSRIIGPDGIGLYSLSYSIALYFTFFALLGINNHGNREIAAVQQDSEKRSKTFWEIYSIQVVAFIVVLLIYVPYTLFWATDRIAALIQGIFVLSSLLDINWFFFGMEKFKLTVLRNAVVKVITVCCIFIFVKSAEDVYIYIAIMAGGYLASQLSIWPFLRRYVHFSKISWKDTLKHLKPTLVLFIPVLSVSIYKIMDKIMLGYMGTITELGYFDNAEKIINVPIALITAIGTVMLPRMTALIAKNKLEESQRYIDRTMLIMLAFGTGAVVGIISVSESFSVLYYGENFRQSGIVMNYLAITILFLACGNVIRSQYLIPNKKDKVFITSAILGSVVNFLINLILIPRLGAVGTAIGTIAAEFVVCFYQLIHVRKSISYHQYLKHQAFFIFSGLAMYAAIKCTPLMFNALISLIIVVLVGTAVYCAMVGWYILKTYNLKLNDFIKKKPAYSKGV